MIPALFVCCADGTEYFAVDGLGPPSHRAPDRGFGGMRFSFVLF